MGTLLANITAIYRKELQSYFAAPLSYVIAGVFWLFSGGFFLWMLSTFTQSALISDQLGMGPVDVPYELLKGFLDTLAILSIVMLPILSMGLYAEERRRGTLELLATAPLTNWVVALGKLLGVLTFFVSMVLPLMVYEAIAYTAADPPLPMRLMLVGHLGLILLGAAILSMGMFISSLTDSTILAAIITFILMVMLLIMSWLTGNATGPIGTAIGHLALLKPYANFSRGIVDVSSIVLFLSYIILGLFLTAQSIELLRFQRS
ncbi:MAG: ABC transporter permease [Leptolyngbyaceae cyanobacterium]